MKIPKFMQRVTGIRGTVREKRFENRALASIEIARRGNVFARGIRGEFVLEPYGLAHVEGGLGGIDSDFEVNVRRVGGKNLPMLRIECGL